MWCLEWSGGVWGGVVVFVVGWWWVEGGVTVQHQNVNIPYTRFSIHQLISEWPVRPIEGINVALVT